ncbi:hypothetical protein GCM10028772_08040 [Nocardioides ultimimeridianus]
MLQFTQNTDPRFPLLYFTVDSAVLAATVLGANLLLRMDQAALLTRLRGTATLGVVMSAVIFALVIAPTPEGGWWQPGADLRVRAATLLLHGVAPLLMAADWVLHPHPSLRARGCEAAVWLLWPVVYLIAISTLVRARVVDSPYPFLNPDPPPQFAAAVSGLIVVFLGAALVLRRVAGFYAADLPRRSE